VYAVNWFRKDANGKFIWPGFGENSRVLAWIVDRLAGKAEARDTAIGRLPADGALDLDGLDISAEQIAELFHIDSTTWNAEADLTQEYYDQFGDRVPAVLREQLDGLRSRLAQ